MVTEVSQNYIDIANAIGCAHKSQKTIARHKKRAINALGENPTQAEIIKWLKKNPPESSRGKQLTPHITTKPRNRKTIDRESSQLKLMRLSFNIRQTTERQHITIEPEYNAALDVISDDKKKWLSDTVSNWLENNGNESVTRIVKCSIVRELVALIKNAR